jgi:hypothetical protein
MRSIRCRLLQLKLKPACVPAVQYRLDPEMHVEIRPVKTLFLTVSDRGDACRQTPVAKERNPRDMLCNEPI